MQNLYALLSVFIVSSISLLAIFSFTLKRQQLNRFLFLLISFSVGGLLGDVFIHLLPEAAESFSFNSGLIVITGLLMFFILEKFIHWRHCHIPTSDKHPHPLAFMNLIGDGLHNFIDGMIIASSYLINFKVGLATTIAVILHEIPQEIGDIGVLLHAGLSRHKVLLYNFLSALLAVLGAVLVLMFGSGNEQLNNSIILITIGGFIYIAASDLIPELHKETQPIKSLYQLLGILGGVFVMFLLTFLE